MNKLIYYFTGTGNSLRIAKEIAKGIEGTRLLSIAKDSIDYPIEMLGIVFPVYFGALPPLVAEFIEKIDTRSIKYIFAVATCNDFPGASLFIVKKLLNKNGKKLNAGFSINMPGNYTPLYPPLPKDKQQSRFKEAEMRVKNILELVKNKQDIKISGLGRVLSFMQKRNNKKLRLRDTRFWVDDKCNDCGICQKICPVNNIELIDGKPQWLHKCQQCLACFHWCPQEAIQVGKKTINRKRYHHPEITLKELMK